MFDKCRSALVVPKLMPMVPPYVLCLNGTICFTTVHHHFFAFYLLSICVVCVSLKSERTLFDAYLFLCICVFWTSPDGFVVSVSVFLFLSFSLSLDSFAGLPIRYGRGNKWGGISFGCTHREREREGEREVGVKK